jgi:phage terminase large subunit-like protein
VGTRLGRQELEAEILNDVPGAMWQQEWIDTYRIDNAKRPPLQEYERIVVAIDPAMKTQDTSVTSDATNETGIIVVGLHQNGHGYVLDDLSMAGSPDQWAFAAINAYRRYMAEAIIVEVNNGGDMIAHTINSVAEGESINIVEVVASRGKTTRAEPISALYAQGKVHHIGMMSDLETQMTTWVPGKTSPDRMDALVWGLTALFVQRRHTPIVMMQGKVAGRD